MSLLQQLDFFEDEAITQIRNDVSTQKESLRKIQKKLFGQMGDMTKMLFELFHKNEELEQKYNDISHLLIETLNRIEQLEGKING